MQNKNNMHLKSATLKIIILHQSLVVSTSKLHRISASTLISCQYSVPSRIVFVFGQGHGVSRGINVEWTGATLIQKSWHHFRWECLTQLPWSPMHCYLPTMEMLRTTKKHAALRRLTPALIKLSHLHPQSRSLNLKIVNNFALLCST